MAYLMVLLPMTFKEAKDHFCCFKPL